MQNYRISVALCTLNGGNFIGPQLESILNQSIVPDEVIICDDASSDNTIDIIHRMAFDRTPVLRIIQNEKKLGCVRNFEKAIKYATGDIIFLSDQDDVWFEEKISTMMIPFRESEETGLVYSDAVLTDAALRPTNYTLFGCRKNMQLYGDRLPYQLIRGVGINGCTMAFRSCLKNFVLPIPDVKGWGHDHWIAFIANAVMNSQPIGKPLMYYRRHGHNFGNDPFLDGGRITRWRIGLNTAGTSGYAQDRYRWEVMLQRLNEIAKNGDLTPENRLRFYNFLSECEQRFEFALLRERVKQVSRIKRMFPLLLALLKGNYYRYLRGMISFLKDVLIS